VSVPILSPRPSVLNAPKGYPHKLADAGLFKDTLLREARTDFFQIRLWDQNALLGALFAHHETLDEDIRADLPLKRVWTLAVEPDARSTPPWSSAFPKPMRSVASARSVCGGSARVEASGHPVRSSSLLAVVAVVSRLSEVTYPPTLVTSRDSKSMVERGRDAASARADKRPRSDPDQRL
jgi:hypothetical protein